MMKKLALLAVAFAAACSSRKSRSEAPTSEPARRSSDGRMAACDRCHMAVYVEEHRCGLTVPCRRCAREHGARHYHEIVRRCPQDAVLMREAHICNDSKVCETCLHATDSNPRCELCRTKTHIGLLSKRCAHCSRQAPIVAVRGITSYCETCNLEVGANHLHGKSEFCGTCLREAGQGHVHDVTTLCVSHGRDCAVDHQHGRTEYCQACRKDVGSNHKHGETVYCLRCHLEVPWPHGHHLGE